MDNKYYTPDIEEFHHGFEYEYFGSNGLIEPEWLPIKFPDPFTAYNSSGLKGRLERKEFRVKYLDGEDIESLGWELKENNLITIRYTYSKLSLELIYDSHTKLIRIQCTHPEWQQVYFEGNIKNKSELKKLMKQIGL